MEIMGGFEDGGGSVHGKDDDFADTFDADRVNVFGNDVPGGVLVFHAKDEKTVDHHAVIVAGNGRELTQKLGHGFRRDLPDGGVAKIVDKPLHAAVDIVQ